ncbi:MAG: hypothetical protein Wins2KO_10120 [Winogradskyella sp.]
MKTKYFVYAVIIAFAIRIVLNLTFPVIAIRTDLDPITYRLIAGGANAFVFFSIVGLLLKIFRYHNKKDFLNS